MINHYITNKYNQLTSYDTQETYCGKAETTGIMNLFGSFVYCGTAFIYSVAVVHHNW